MNATTAIIESALAASSAIAATAGYATFAPRSRIWGNVHWRGPRDLPARIAITFDDGPTAPYTDRILDTLGELGVRATFFVIGRNVERAPQLLNRMQREGHVISNHTFDHPHYGFIRGQNFWRDQIRRTDDLIESILAARPAIFRPPIGFKTRLLMSAARQQGHELVNWSRRGMDGIKTTSPAILRRLRGATAGDILLLHDGVEPHRPRDPTPTVHAIGPLIGMLKARGIEMVSVDELLGVRPYQHEAGRNLQDASHCGSVQS